MAALMQKIAEMLRLVRLEKRWHKAACILAAVVVFCTTYMLILPAITMESRTSCGMSEHIHKFSCYLDDDVLICTVPEHTHSDSCYIKATDGNLTDGNVTDGNINVTDIPEPETTQPVTSEPDSGKIVTTEHNETTEQTVPQSTSQQQTSVPSVQTSVGDRNTASDAFIASLTQEEKLALSFLSDEDRKAVLELSYAIYCLPGVEEFYSTLDGYYENGDEDGEIQYMTDTQESMISAYAQYQNMEHLESYIIGLPKLYELKDIYSNFSISTFTTGTSSAVTFNYINRGWSAVAPVVIYGGNATEKITTGSAINQYWNGIVVEYNSTEGYYYVSNKYAGKSSTSATTVRSLEATTAKGFVIFIWMADSDANATQKAAANVATNVEIGDRVLVSVDPTTLSSGYSSGGYGTVQFYEYIPPEVETEEDLELYKDTSEPSDSQIDDGGGKVTSADGAVITTKTIDGTSEENVFDITLTVQTKTDVQTFLDEPDMAVVIVMDISNTMNTKFTNDTISRYDAAVVAASSFIDQFAENTSGLSKIGFVAFNTSAHEIFSLQSCANTSQATALKNEMMTDTGNIIDNYVTDDRTRFTNVEGGLKRAYDMLKDSGNANQYVILLTDGFPTTYLKDNSASSRNYEGYDPYTPSGTKGADGVFYDYVTGYYCSYGTSYSDKASIKARQMATSIKDSGGKIFSVGVDVAGQTIEMYDGRTGLSVIDRTSTTYEIGGANDLNAYKNWLGNSVGSGYYYDSTDQAGITAAFNKIFEEIRKLNEQSTKTVWTATDPMPVHDEESQVVGFIHFYDKDGNVVGAPDPETLTGTHAEGAENTANHKDNVVYWDLKKSGYTTTTEGSVTTYYYKLKYRVRLVNEAPPFVENTVYDTNGEAHLDYKTIVTTNGVQEASELKNVSFSKPAVHGYVAGFSFFKKDDFSKPLEGAEFSLIHDDGSCSLCHGDGTAITDSTTHDNNYTNYHKPHVIGPYTAVSSGDGTVTFTDIPSGHSYVMVETLIPPGYIDSGSTYNVVVAYDELTVTETKRDGIVKIWDSAVNEVFNYGHILPETGGIGVHWFYMAGAALMIASVVILLKRKKK